MVKSGLLRRLQGLEKLHLVAMYKLLKVIYFLIALEKPVVLFEMRFGSVEKTLCFLLLSQPFIW